jgi:death on curing protein
MNSFNSEDILLLHFKIIDDFGGSHGVRDEGRLASVLAAPFQEVFGEKLYPTVFEQSAVYARNIIADHPFVDGNKRTAITLAVIYIQRCGFVLTATPKQLEDFAVQVAVDHLDIPYIAAWLKAHSKKAPTT